MWSSSNLGINLFIPSEKGKMHFNTAELHMAIIYKNYEAVTHIVSSAGKLDGLWRGVSPVSCALYSKAYQILEYLIEQGANVNIRTKDYKMEPPLFAACRLGNLKAVKIILKSPTLDINQRDFFDRTSLWAAARYSSFEIVELLLNHGADVRAAQDFIQCPLLQSLIMTQRDHFKIPTLLIQRGCVLDFKNREGSALYFAVKFVNRELFCLLVNAGCKVPDELWLKPETLPCIWREDHDFTKWACSLYNNPRSLIQLATCSIRNTLCTNHKNIFPSYVYKLPVPPAIHSLILLEN